MSLLDWFRPAWKHSSPEVRRQAIAAMDRDHSVLAQTLKTDPDAGVRAVALAKIDDAELLQACAEHDKDPKLRQEASDRLDEQRVREALHANDETRARLALSRVRGSKRFVEIALRAEWATTRRFALEKVADEAALLEVVRGTKDAALRGAAFERLQDAKLLKDLALHDAPRDLQLRAVERLDDLPSLEVVAQRAQAKGVRAAAAEKVRARKPQAPARDARKDAARDADEQRTRQLAEAEDRKRRAVAEERAARAQAAAAAAKAQQAAAAEAEAARVAAAQPASDPVAEARRAEAAARREDERVRREEERVRREAERAQREAERAEREAARADEEARFVADVAPVSVRLEGLLTSDDRRALDEAVKAARDLRWPKGKLGAEAEAARARFDAARTATRARLGELRDAEMWRRWANVPKFEALIKLAEELLADETVEAKLRAQGLKALQAEWKALGAAPRERADGLWARFKEVADKIHGRAQEGFAAKDEERAANLEKKKELCTRAEALVDSTDWKATAALYKDLQDEWKAIGPVPKEEADALWTRFRTACDKFFERRKEAFAGDEAERVANLGKLLELCAAAESLAGSTDWRGAGDQMKSLQASWKEVGMAGKTKAEADAAWTRFRTACDKFFERRKAAFEAEDEKRKVNLEKKQALLSKAEALAAGEEVADPDSTIRALMQEWKAVGPVPREEADALWEKFRTACDRIRSPEMPEMPADTADHGPGFGNRALEGLADKLKN